MRAVVLGLLLVACSEPRAIGGAVDPPTARLGDRADALMGTWIVTSLNGEAVPEGQDPLRMTIDSARATAGASCVSLGELGHAWQAGDLVLAPPPPGEVASCARGLSPFEKAFEEAFRPGARVRADGVGLRIEGDAGTVDLVRKPASGEPVRLALLPPSREGDAAATAGRLEVDGPCLYIRGLDGDRTLPALLTPDARWDAATEVLQVGDHSLVPGSRVELGGSMRGRSSELHWRQAPDPRCDQSRIWVASSMKAR